MGQGQSSEEPAVEQKHLGKQKGNFQVVGTVRSRRSEVQRQRMPGDWPMHMVEVGADQNWAVAQWWALDMGQRASMHQEGIQHCSASCRA